MTGKCREGAVVDGKYRIIRRIGNGATSTVYLARHVRTHKFWAIKELRQNTPAGDAIARNSLNAEIEILKRLSHPLLPCIVDVTEDARNFYIIMEYFPGKTLEEMTTFAQGLGRSETVRIGMQLCDVLCYLHERRIPIIYRDLKPANIILNPDGRIRLIDFGAAVLYGHIPEETVCDGTPGYAAPEQRQGYCDVRTDIYCLGKTLYHLYTGQAPRADDKSVPDKALARIIAKCTALCADDRYASVRDVMKDLERLSVERSALLKRGVMKGAALLSAALLVCAFAASGLLLRGTEGETRRDIPEYRERASVPETDLPGERLKETPYYAETTDTWMDASDYRKRWTDLNDRLRQAAAGAGDTGETLSLCREVLFQIHMNAALFRDAGIRGNEMEAALSGVRSLLETEAMRDAAQGEAAEGAAREDLMETTGLAEKTLLAVYDADREKYDIMR